MDKDKYIGRLLDGRYEILEVIGTGGMAVVYKARCHRLNRLVAIKILKDEYSKDEEFRRRFHAESQAVAMLSHPNIVSVYDVSRYDDSDYIVMELIDGISLKQYIEKKQILNWKETLHFAIQIAKALEHAHSRGIVHRDIKPHNVMVLKNGSVKVADFGIAQMMSSGTTLTKEALGSVHYISPEQAKGGRVDNRSDIYSLGIVMYEMISGRVPYDGDTPVAVAIQHINGGAQNPSALNPNTPRGLEQIIMKAMARYPRDRYSTATAMLYDMDEFRKEPTMVFPEAPTAMDDSTQALPSNIEKELAEQAPQTIAQRTAKRAEPQPRQEKKTVRQQEEPRGHGAAIAIGVCALVAVIAVAIILGVMLSKPEAKISVPNLVGQNFDSIQIQTDIVIVRQGSEYSEDYEKGQIIDQRPVSGIQVVPGTKVFVTVSLGAEPPAKTMEDLVGLKAEEAQKFLDGLDLKLHIINREETNAQQPQGYVTRTEPAEGAPLTSGQTITLYVSLGPEIVKEKMPNVVGKDIKEALSILEEKGFNDVHQNPVDSSRPKGEVVDQSEEWLDRIDVTTPIILDVSTGVSELPTTPPTLPTVTDPEQTEPDPTDPPETTGPDEGMTTLTRFFILPTRTESYFISVTLDGQWVVENMEIAPGQTGVTIPLTGKGTMECVLYIDDIPYETMRVEFDPDD